MVVHFNYVFLFLVLACFLWGTEWGLGGECVFRVVCGAWLFQRKRGIFLRRSREGAFPMGSSWFSLFRGVFSV